MNKNKIQMKEHKVIPVHSPKLIADFLDGKFDVLGVECNCTKVYGSALQKRVGTLFPNVVSTPVPDHASNLDTLGTTDFFRVWPNRPSMYVANMYVSKSYGFKGAKMRGNHRQPLNQFDPEALMSAFDDLVHHMNVSGLVDKDRKIGLSRFYGGLGGVPWAKVCEVLDAACEKHGISIYVYLPENYDSAYTARDRSCAKN